MNTQQMRDRVKLAHTRMMYFWIQSLHHDMKNNLPTNMIYRCAKESFHHAIKLYDTNRWVK